MAGNGNVVVDDLEDSLDVCVEERINFVSKIILLKDPSFQGIEQKSCRSVNCQLA